MPWAHSFAGLASVAAGSVGHCRGLCLGSSLQCDGPTKPWMQVGPRTGIVLWVSLHLAVADLRICGCGSGRHVRRTGKVRTRQMEKMESWKQEQEGELSSGKREEARHDEFDAVCDTGLVESVVHRSRFSLLCSCSFLIVPPSPFPRHCCTRCLGQPRGAGMHGWKRRKEGWG